MNADVSELSVQENVVESEVALLESFGGRIEFVLLKATNKDVERI